MAGGTRQDTKERIKEGKINMSFTSTWSALAGEHGDKTSIVGSDANVVNYNDV